MWFDPVRSLGKSGHYMNCLGYVVRKYEWLWPWFNDPSLKTALEFLEQFGFKLTENRDYNPKYQKVIIYGTDKMNTMHFARLYNKTQTIAKEGEKAISIRLINKQLNTYGTIQAIVEKKK